MKIINLLLSFIFAGGLVACAQISPLPPDQLAANLGPLSKIEEEADRVMLYSQILESKGGMSDENAKVLKMHFDVYNVYYTAAILQLAGGNKESYLTDVQLAAGELQAMEAILKDKLAKLAESK